MLRLLTVLLKIKHFLSLAKWSFKQKHNPLQQQVCKTSQCHPDLSWAFNNILYICTPCPLLEVRGASYLELEPSWTQTGHLHSSGFWWSAAGLWWSAAGLWVRSKQITATDRRLDCWSYTRSSTCLKKETLTWEVCHSALQRQTHKLQTAQDTAEHIPDQLKMSFLALYLTLQITYKVI